MPPTHPKGPHSLFTRFARATSRAAGRPLTFCIALAIVIGWAFTGPMFDYSDTWQLVINTGTTVITFLMVFVIQHTQNHDAEAVQVQLAELIRAVEGAQNSMVDLDALDDDALDRLRDKYAAIAERARARSEEQGTRSEEEGTSSQNREKDV